MVGKGILTSGLFESNPNYRDGLTPNGIVLTVYMQEIFNKLQEDIVEKMRLSNSMRGTT